MSERLCAFCNGPAVYYVPMSHGRLMACEIDCDELNHYNRERRGFRMVFSYVVGFMILMVGLPYYVITRPGLFKPESRFLPGWSTIEPSMVKLHDEQLKETS